MLIEPFSIQTPDAALADLKQRLQNTRWVDDFANDQWQCGTNGSYLRELVDYWLTQYDWRVHERAMNALPQFRAVIDGVRAFYRTLVVEGRCVPSKLVDRVEAQSERLQGGG